MDDTSTIAIPSWALLPVALCLLPLVQGEITFALIGVAGAALCVIAVRTTRWTRSLRVNLTVAIVALCWVAAGGTMGTRVALERASGEPRVSLDSEVQRRAIFATAMRDVDRIATARREIGHAEDRDQNTRFLEKRLDIYQHSHALNQSFVLKRYRLSEEQLAAIIDEGLRNGWSTS